MQNRTATQDYSAGETSNATVYSADGGLQARPRVRSQAMRDYRRRQRADGGTAEWRNSSAAGKIEKEYIASQPSKDELFQDDLIFEQEARPLAMFSGFCLQAFEMVLGCLREFARPGSGQSPLQVTGMNIGRPNLLPGVHAVANERLTGFQRQYHIFRLWYEGLDFETGNLDKNIKRNSILLSSVLSFLIDLGKLLCVTPIALELDPLRTHLNWAALQTHISDATQRLRVDRNVSHQRLDIAVGHNGSDTSDSSNDDDLTGLTAEEFDDELVTRVECLCELGPALQRLALSTHVHSTPEEPSLLGDTTEPEVRSSQHTQTALSHLLDPVRHHLEDYWVLRFREMQQESTDKDKYTVAFSPAFAELMFSSHTANSNAGLPQNVTGEEITLCIWLESLKVYEPVPSDVHREFDPNRLLQSSTGTGLSLKASVRSTTSTRTQESGYHSNLVWEPDPMELVEEEEDRGEEDGVHFKEADRGPSKSVYCYCDRPPYGEMIACDHIGCAKEWFHLGCTELQTVPSEYEKWYCTDCRAHLEISHEDINMKEETPVDDNVQCSSCGVFCTSSDIAGHVSNGNGLVCFKCALTEPEAQSATVKVESAQIRVREEHESGNVLDLKDAPVALQGFDWTTGDLKVPKSEFQRSFETFAKDFATPIGESTHKGVMKQNVLEKQPKWSSTPGPDNPNSKECPVSACQYHLKGFDDEEERDRHVVTHYDSMRMCPFCPANTVRGKTSFNGLKSLKVHLLSKHRVCPNLLGSQSPGSTSNRNAKSPSVFETEEGRRPWSGNFATQRPPVKTMSLVPPSSATVTGSDSSKILSDLDTAYTKEVKRKQDAATCSLCQSTLTSAQFFYDHLDQCVVQHLEQVCSDPFTDQGDLKVSKGSKVSLGLAKAGCLTCRKRRITCNEERPACSNCVTSNRHCEGYYRRVISKVPGPDVVSYTHGSTDDSKATPQAEHDHRIKLKDSSISRSRRSAFDRQRQS